MPFHSEASDPKNKLDEWLTYISSHHHKTIDMSLERVNAVWQQMYCHAIPLVVTVGGTNGKGSTCAILTHILVRAGYKIGTYTSPHLWIFNERIAINGEPVSCEQIVEAFEKIEKVRGTISLTYFEWATLAAFWIFAEQALDIWILEVGMGGRLDATNLIDADVAVITSIDLDHQAFLGNTREAIGLEKLGIARTGCPLIIGDAHPPLTVVDAAQKQKVITLELGKAYGYLADSNQQWQYWVRGQEGSIKRRFGLPWPALRGEHQLTNASTALTVLEYINHRLPVSMQAVREGLLSVSWPGRFQVLPGQPVTLFDVAHNPHAMKALAKNLERMPFFPTTWCLWGMLADKDAESCARLLKPHIQRWVVCSLEGERARSGKELEAILKAIGVPATEINVFDTPHEGIMWVREQAQLADRIVVTGSFSMLSPLF